MAKRASVGGIEPVARVLELPFALIYAATATLPSAGVAIVAMVTGSTTLEWRISGGFK